MDSNTVKISEVLFALQTNRDFVREFKLLQTQMYNTAKQKGWHDPSKSFGEQVVMMHSELSEVIEAYRTENGDATNIWMFDEKDVAEDIGNNSDGLVNEKPEGVPIEFADLIIRVLDTCEFYGIDLIDAIFMKAKFNLTRPHRHGNKKL